MTIEQIKEWCSEHAMMRSQLEVNELTYSRIRFENGDVYECSEYDDNGRLYDTKTVTIRINGQIANVSRYSWDGNIYGWRRIA